MASNISTPSAPIGVFDSGFGGLSILREIRKVLPQYDYILFTSSRCKRSSTCSIKAANS